MPKKTTKPNQNSTKVKVRKARLERLERQLKLNIQKRKNIKKSYG